MSKASAVLSSLLVKFHLPKDILFIRRIGFSLGLPSKHYLFKVNNRKTSKRIKISSKLTIRILERRQ